MSAITGAEWIKLVLSKMGIDPSIVSRVVIDATYDGLVSVYVSLFATDALLEVIPPTVEEVRVVIVTDGEQENGKTN